MFTTPNVKAFLKSATFDSAKEGEAIASLRFYVTPIKFDLAKEIDIHVADRLFRKESGEWKPVQECSKMPFDKVSPAACSMQYRMHEEIEDGAGMIEHVEFTSLEAFKLFSDDPNFTLAFKVVFPVNDKDLTWFFIQRLRTTVLLTFAKVQGELPFVAKTEHGPTASFAMSGRRTSTRTAPPSATSVKSCRGTVKKLTRDGLVDVRPGGGPSPEARKKAIAENEATLSGKRKPGRPAGSKTAKTAKTGKGSARNR